VLTQVAARDLTDVHITATGGEGRAGDDRRINATRKNSKLTSGFKSGRCPASDGTG